MKDEKQEKAVLVRQYKNGYRKKPEGKREAKAAEAAAVYLLGAYCPAPESEKGDRLP